MRKLPDTTYSVYYRIDAIAWPTDDGWRCYSTGESKASAYQRARHLLDHIDGCVEVALYKLEPVLDVVLDRSAED